MDIISYASGLRVAGNKLTFDRRSCMRREPSHARDGKWLLKGGIDESNDGANVAFVGGDRSSIPPRAMVSLR